MYQAVGFDSGETLVHYPGVPLSWQSLYKEALEHVAKSCSYDITPDNVLYAEKILLQYNTRVNPRIKEISSDEIFGEILSAWSLSKRFYLKIATHAFFSFFQRKMLTYKDSISLLKFLHAKQIKVGILTDVPYGMDKSFVENDLRSISDFIDSVISSRDVGFRKPDPRGYRKLAQQLGVRTSQMMYIGNEEKDIVGANAAGVFSIFIDREKTERTYGEKIKVTSLLDLQILFS